MLDGGVTEPPERDWSLVQEHLIGPESLLAALRRPITDNGGDLVLHTTYVSVARAGEFVVIVADVGWEAGSGSPDPVCQLTPVAVERATAGGMTAGAPRFSGRPGLVDRPVGPRWRSDRQGGLSRAVYRRAGGWR
jgi:hypothetical protein